METLYRKGDILIAIDPCIMEDTKDRALIPGKEYVIFKSTRNTIWINSEIGEHRFEIEELSEFFDEVIKSDNTQIEKLQAEKKELLEALEGVVFKVFWNGGTLTIDDKSKIESLIKKHRK